MLFTKPIIVFLFVGTATKSCPVRIETGSTLSTSCVTGPAEDPGVSNTAAADLYAVFLADQKKQEIEWSANQAAKKAKVISNESVTETSSSLREEFASIRKQLDEQNEECDLLRKQLLDLQQTNNDVAKSQLDRKENLYNVSEQQQSKMYVLVELSVHAL